MKVQRTAAPASATAKKPRAKTNNRKTPAARKADDAKRKAAKVVAIKETARLAVELMRVAIENGIPLTPKRAHELAARLHQRRQQRATGKPKKRRPKIAKRSGYTGCIARMQEHVTARGWVVQVGNHCRII